MYFGEGFLQESLSKIVCFHLTHEFVYFAEKNIPIPPPPPSPLPPILYHTA